MIKLILFIVSMAFTCVTLASEISGTKVTRTMMDATYGLVLFVQVEGSPDRTNCHSNSMWDYVLATDSELGKQMLSKLMAAHASNRTVKIKGNDTCPVGSTEAMTRLEIY
ncbi:hypothetical protein [Aliiglaciecola sp. M165]|uniref:hypothetical protein n=1 Tax=Aliiglaciecola sp. M165 TaxID=2593649 RepID=UPI00117C1650|nr:hypothetical protein [Aliiglaciecola sp. M165]TRY33405.1 hypothetical protein FM019_05370 [Aliiglaciecola sp. M165]